MKNEQKEATITIRSLANDDPELRSARELDWLTKTLADKGLLCSNCGAWRILKQPDGDIEQCGGCGDEAFNIYYVSSRIQELL